MNSQVLETQRLTKRFGALTVVDNVDFTLLAGARQALIGPNGAGKTTFVNLVTGRREPTSGQILLRDEDVTPLPEHMRVQHGLGRTFQITSLFGELSVLENVALAKVQRSRIAWRMWRPIGAYREILDEAYQLLDQLGISEEATRRVKHLAYGQQRLVELAVALALQPQVLLLDEPTAGIGSNERFAIVQALEQLPSEIAILLIEHDMDVVFQFAQKITVLDVGKVIAEGPPEEIARNKYVQEAYFGRQLA